MTPTHSRRRPWKLKNGAEINFTQDSGTPYRGSDAALLFWRAEPSKPRKGRKRVSKSK